MLIEAYRPDIPIVLLADEVVTTERSHDLKFDYLRDYLYSLFSYTCSYRKDGYFIKS